MKIETKYDIKQKVWVAVGLYLKDEKHPLEYFAYQAIIEEVLINSHFDEFYKVAEEQYGVEEVFLTKKACEQAIEEMEDNDR